MLRRRLVVLAPLVAALVVTAMPIAGPTALVGCASPTLPLPPPALPTVSLGSEAGKVKLMSERGVEPNALIVIYNRNPAVPLDRRVGGAQADAVGTWDAEVYATKGDILDVTQESETHQSPPVSVKVP